jgi:hypothetical protein
VLRHSSSAVVANGVPLRSGCFRRWTKREYNRISYWDIPDQVLASEQAYRAACKMTTSALGFSNVDAVADACTNYYSKTKIRKSPNLSCTREKVANDFQNFQWRPR